jgi:hypothetical protein
MWTIPEAYAKFGIPDYLKRRVEKCSDLPLKLWRNQEQDKLESIQSGAYYQRDNVIGGLGPVTWYNPNEKTTKYYLDCGQTYALLYAIDTEIERRKEAGTWNPVFQL